MNNYINEKHYYSYYNIETEENKIKPNFNTR